MPKNCAESLKKIFQDITPRAIGGQGIALVAKQPIFDGKGKVCAYELLFRDPSLSRAGASSSHAATSTVMIDGFHLMRPSLLPGQRFFINFTEELITAKLPLILPACICVIEILESVRPTEFVMQSLLSLKKAGYLLALDDYTGQEELKPFLPLVDIVKVEVLRQSKDHICAIAADLKSLKVTMLAEKVEDHKTELLCKSLGFHLFQGFFFSKAELVTGKKITPSQITKTRLLTFSSKEDADIFEVTETISADVSLTFKLLHYVNSVYFGLAIKIKTVHHAVMLIGKVKLMQWLYVTTLADIDTAPLSREIAYISALRAKFLETVGKTHFTSPNEAKNTPPLLFLLGLFSLIENILQLPLSEITASTPMDTNIVMALEGNGPLHIWLDLVKSYERGQWGKTKEIAQQLSLTDADLAKAYAEAAVWSSTFFGGS